MLRCFFFLLLAGVCCPVLGEQFLCQRFTPEKPEACVCHQFPERVCGSVKAEQEDRRCETSELREETAVASASE